MSPRTIGKENPKAFIESFIKSLETKNGPIFSQHFLPEKPFFDIFITKKTVNSYETLMKEHQEAFFRSEITQFSPKIAHLIHDQEEGVCIGIVEADVLRSRESHTRDVLMIKAKYDDDARQWFICEIFNTNIRPTL